MPWRVHLTNHAIQQCAILPGSPVMVAAWTRRNRIHYFELESGASCGDAALPDAPAAKHSSEIWQLYLASLTAPDGRTILPLVRTPDTAIYATDDGKMRLYRTEAGLLTLETDGNETVLASGSDANFRAIDLDRALGTIAALDESGSLHIWQQDISIGTFTIGLAAVPDLRMNVAVARGGETIFAADGRRLATVDSGGQVKKIQEVHYNIGRLACSPDGSMVVTSDTDAGVIRAYQGATLMPTHQKFAWDLAAVATQLQLLAELPQPETAVNHLLAHSGGVIVFAMGGILCATDLTQLDELPQPRPLL
jgi:hypothetical protein